MQGKDKKREKIKVKQRLKRRQKITVPYLQAIPEIVLYEVVSKLILLAIVTLLKLLMQWSIYKTGRVAVSSGDFAFVFKSPYGWIAILTGVILIGAYFAFDINVIVNYAGEKVKERPTVLWKIVLESIAESSSFFTPGGLLVLLYATIIAPIVGTGLSISLTDNLYVPNFITSVIKSTPLYNVSYTAFVILMVAVGVFGMFTIHGMIIDNIPAIKSYIRSAKIVFHNFWKIAKDIFFYVATYFVVSLAIIVTIEIIPFILIALFGLSNPVGEMGFVTMLLFFYLFILANAALFLPLFVMKMTQIYYEFCDNAPIEFRTKPITSVKAMVAVIVSAYIFCWVASFVIENNFEDFFPSAVYTNVIGHRGAGNEGGENTIEGIEKAIELGCYGTEIDIQRTTDGYYVLNHDNNFKRVAGDKRSPTAMTLAEVKALKLINEPGSTVPTLDEVLDVSGDRIMLFIELKGSSADKRMCDDVVKMIKERGMENNCVLISLKYNLVEYIEDNYPEIYTGYLAFITLGDVGALKCDYLGLEEEAATESAINAAHENGRKVMVWTPNGESSQKKFIMSDADAIITDNLTQARTVFEALVNRSEIERIADFFLERII